MQLHSLIYPDEPSVFSGNDVEKFILWCVEQKASDITIKTEEKIICEIYGQKIRVTRKPVSRSEMISIINFIYQSDGAISKLNFGEDIRKSWSIRLDRIKTIRFRVTFTSILAQGHKGYEITIRVIESTAPLLEDLRLPQIILDNLYYENGLILIVGATGSGKSTLLASIMGSFLRDIKSNFKILTYENPIEQVYDDIPQLSSFITQSEIPTHLPTFADGIKNALTRAPDIIVVGEMKDTETISEGVNASMTGHLVFSTLHTESAPSAIRRMVNSFLTEEKNARTIDILTNIRMIIAQKLVPSTDGKRIAIREYLVLTEELVESIIEKDLNNLTSALKKAMIKHGRTFIQDAQEKLNEGLISEEEFNKIKKYYKNK